MEVLNGGSKGKASGDEGKEQKPMAHGTTSTIVQLIMDSLCILIPMAVISMGIIQSHYYAIHCGSLVSMIPLMINTSSLIVHFDDNNSNPKVNDESNPNNNGDGKWNWDLYIGFSALISHLITSLCSITIAYFVDKFNQIKSFNQITNHINHNENHSDGNPIETTSN